MAKALAKNVKRKKRKFVTEEKFNEVKTYLAKYSDKGVASMTGYALVTVQRIGQCKDWDTYCEKKKELNTKYWPKAEPAKHVQLELKDPENKNDFPDEKPSKTVSEKKQEMKENIDSLTEFDMRTVQSSLKEMVLQQTIMAKNLARIATAVERRPWYKFW